jgi:hypothetical protein
MAPTLPQIFAKPGTKFPGQTLQLISARRQRQRRNVLSRRHLDAFPDHDVAVRVSGQDLARQGEGRAE